jgi:hypothetical protein
VQLINAFESPIRATGLVPASRKAAEEHHTALKTTWGITTAEEVIVPDAPLATLVEKLTSHVS